MGREIFLLVLVSFFFFGSVSAVGICIDNENPGFPDGLSVSGSSGNFLIEWGAAVDYPSCGRVAEYVISRDGVELGRTDGLNFVDGDSLGEGEYSYTVYAVDMVGRNAGQSFKNIVKVNRGGGSSSSSSSGSSTGFKCFVDWYCGEWSDCVDGKKVRECVDLHECGTPYLKPEEEMDCFEEELNSSESLESNTPQDRGFSSFFTGAVIGGGASWGLALLFVLVVVGFYYYSRKK